MQLPWDFNLVTPMLRGKKVLAPKIMVVVMVVLMIILMGMVLRVLMIIDMIKWRGWQTVADDTFLLPSKQALVENMQQQVRQEIL